jgi:hypothetical protein
MFVFLKLFENNIYKSSIEWRSIFNMKNKIIIVAVTILIVFSGCSRDFENSQQPQQQQLSFEKSKNEVPKDLEKIEESIEKIFLVLNGPASNVEKDKNTQDLKGNTDKKEEEKSENKEDEKKNEEKKEKKEESDKNTQNSNDSKDSKQTDWQKADSTINNLHYQWNNFTSFAMETNAPRELIDNFSVSLNNLTNMVLNRESVNSLMATNNLYSYIPDLYMLFDTPYSPEIKRLRHYTRSTILNALTDNWDDSEKDLQNLKSSWSFYKTSIQKDRPERTNKLDYSIHELEMVVNEKNKSLSSIKGKVTLNNIDVLEKEEKKK